MTFCTLRRDGQLLLGLRTARGILDVEHAARLLGYPPEKQVWLKPCDEVRTSIGDLGELRFTLAAEQA